MYGNILLPTDGLGKCRYGACHGVLLAKALGARITAVCVTEKYFHPGDPGDLQFRIAVKVYRGRGHAGGHTARRGSAQGTGGKRAGRRGEDVRGERRQVREGIPRGESPADGILKAAKEKECGPHLHIDPRQPGVDGRVVRDVGVEDPLAFEHPRPRASLRRAELRWGTDAARRKLPYGACERTRINLSALPVCPIPPSPFSPGRPDRTVWAGTAPGP